MSNTITTTKVNIHDKITNLIIDKIKSDGKLVWDRGFITRGAAKSFITKKQEKKYLINFLQK